MDYEIINQQCVAGIDIFKKANTLICNNKKDSPYVTLVNNLDELNKRYADQNLTACIVGEVKTGKSSFIDSLLGTDILAVAPEVCTNVPTKIVYGKEEKIIVYFMGDESGKAPAPKEITRQEITAYSTEKGNRENRERVDFIEVHLNSPLLAEGLAFIDTPGLGAIDPLHALATFRIAAQADIIFFLGACTKPLTQSEVESLKNILIVSKPKEVYHLLTQCDLKQSNEVLDSNRKILEKDEDLKEYNIQIIEVSSNLHDQYQKDGRVSKLEDSGFRKVKAVIDDLNSRLKDIVFGQYRTFAAYHCGEGHGLLQEAVDSVEKPDAVDAKKRELEALLNRLTTINEKKSVWSVKLSGKQKTLSNSISQFVDDKHKKIYKDIEDLLNNGNYFIKNTDELSQRITAFLSEFDTELKVTIVNGFANLQEWLRRETGFIEIKGIIADRTLPEADKIRLKEAETDIGQLITDTWRVALVGGGLASAGVALGGWAGGWAGTKFGAMLGFSVGGPVGAALGSAIGLFTGVVGGWLVGKSAKGKREEKARKEILLEVNKNLKDYFNNVKRELNKIDIENSTVILVAFNNDIAKEQKSLKGRIDNLATQSQRIHANLDAIKKLKEDCELICENLNSDEK